MGIYISGAGTLGCAVWPKAGIACSQGIPPNFYPLHVHVEPPVLPPLPHHTKLHLCTSPPVFKSPSLRLIWKNLDFLYPWLSDFYTVRFSDGSGFYLFWSLLVIFSAVTKERKACLPTLSSWAEVFFFFFFFWVHLTSILLWKFRHLPLPLLCYCCHKVSLFLV